MLASLIAERYAKALLHAAQAQHSLEAVGAQAGELGQALELARGAERFLANPVAESQVKLRVLSGCLDDGGHPLFKAFLDTVLRQKRERFLPEILAAFKALRDEAEGRLEADLGTARDLPEDERQLLESALGRRLGRQVTLRPYTDRSLLGGAVLRVGDTVYDGSLSARLKRLGNILAAGPPPRARRPAPAKAAKIEKAGKAAKAGKPGRTGKTGRTGRPKGVRKAVKKR